MEETLVTIPAVAMLLVEGFKWVLRKYMISDPFFEIPAEWYLVIVPIAEVIAAPLLVMGGFMVELPAYMDISSVGAFFSTLLHVGIQAIVSMFLYNGSIQRLKSAYTWQQTSNVLANLDFSSVTAVETTLDVADDGEGLG